MDEFLKHCLLLDLEVHPDTGAIHKIGALFRGQVFLRQGRFLLSEALAELDTFAIDAQYVLGHNIIEHDLPVLLAAAPNLELHRKAAIDTLYLSPLAFPHNPYHRLVKGYKLVRDSVNDPVADARLAAELFVDECQAFSNMKASKEGDLVAFYRFCLETESPGFASVFQALGIPIIQAATAVQLLKQKKYAGRVCRNALRDLLSQPLNRAALAYAVAWLSVAGGNSVLPPWVRYRFPDIIDILHRLRDVDCGDAACAWCRENHDAVGHLRNFFDYPAYRPQPAAPDGGSLQQHIVEAGMRQSPLLAILPTGGGKSLCYQVPALVRYLRRGLLTIVISPLQALMKDQVDGLEKRTDAPFAYALYGMSTPPERNDVLEKVRLGDAAILYVSPEQLRNKSFHDTIAQREIGCWVFDEAHCLSKWGHDFRPDYLYAGRFVREFAREHKQPVPPVACFTATAKQDVIEEIRAYFLRELEQDLALFEGGVERDNLSFQVHLTGKPEKHAHVHRLLKDLPADGSAVVYVATRKHAENLAEFLVQHDQSMQAAAFHAGLEAPRKQEIQNAFIAGEIPVICATNAFGMGIDKENVRLVIHADIPASLENYLQEAGRAGRDRRPAECVLLYDEQDIETQFRLNALSELSQRDIAQILRALRRARRKDCDTVVITSGELLRDDSLELSFEADDRQVDTKVKTAVSWLERAGLVERNQNRTSVFQGKPLLDLAQAEARLPRLKLPQAVAGAWLRLFEVMLNADMDEGMSADQLAEQAAITVPEDKNITPAQQVIRYLNDMAAQGFISQGMQLTAFIRPGGKNNAEKVFQAVSSLEAAMLDLIREQEPDAAQQTWLDVSLRALNQGLLDRGHDSNPETLRLLLRSLAYDGRGMAGSRGSLDLRYIQQNHYKVRLQREWSTLQHTAERRRAVAGAILQHLLRKAGNHSGEILLSFSYDELLQALHDDLVLRAEIKDPQAAVERGLLFLHEQHALILQQGLAVFRQAMTIDILPSAKGRRYAKGDYEALRHHYAERILQVHVMNEYARLGLEKIREALNLVAAYFLLERKHFIEKYFGQRNDMLERATSAESYRAIVESLGNPVQISIVAAHTEENSLILAGPGSGKTRTVVHRCAYLLRVERVPPRSILVLCFNRHAALELRRRLRDLVGDDARGVTIQTYHGLALRLSGTALNGKRAPIDFEQLIADATGLLRGNRGIPGLAADELRERLLAGYRYILVDEYQDIDRAQYEFISAIAGRTEQDPEAKLSILAVGDDDQSIYGFRGANVEFIHRFEQDYRARRYYLTDNYRSSAHIIEAAGSLIAHNRERMKNEHPIHIDKQRRHQPPGGIWQQRDPVSQGRVQIFPVDDVGHQTYTLIAELQRLQTLDNTWEWRDCAILASRWDTLMPIRALCEARQIPLVWGLDSDNLPALSRVREIAMFLDKLKVRSSEYLSPDDLHAVAGGGNVWHTLLHEFTDAWRLEAGDDPQPSRYILEYFYDTLREYRRQRGDGIFITTIHRAKGLEFKHVFIPAGPPAPAGKGDEEEPRRLFYVAMTRARETLHLFQRRDCETPYIALLAGDIRYRDAASAETIDPDILQYRFDVLGLSDIFLNYAGTHPDNHSIHRALSKRQPGDILFLHMHNNKLLLQDKHNQTVAQLSKAGQNRWQARLPHITEIRVLAMLERNPEDSEEEWRANLRSKMWEVPLCEMKWRIK